MGHTASSSTVSSHSMARCSQEPCQGAPRITQPTTTRMHPLGAVRNHLLLRHRHTIHMPTIPTPLSSRRQDRVCSHKARDKNSEALKAPVYSCVPGGCST